MSLDAAYVVAHSLTFDERIALLRGGAAATGARDAGSQAVAALRLDMLRRRLTLSDGRSLFGSRLRERNVSLSLAADACAPHFQAECLEPEWSKWFLLGVENLAMGRTSALTDDLPFDLLLGAFESSALTCISEQDHQDLWSALPESARRSARSWLRERVAGVLQWCLFHEFDGFRRRRGRLAGSYEAFVRQAMSTDWASSFFTKYAGSARTIGSLILYWSSNVLLLLSRFKRDQREIVREFGFERPLRIETFERFPSDSHAGGQSVAIIRLASGDRLVYKPTDQSLASLWTSINAVCLDSSLKTDPLLRTGYGWQRYVAPGEPQSADVSARSLGGALAVATAIGSTDLHFENFVPTDTGLVLVDHETVFSPRVNVRALGWTRAQQTAFEAIADSVLVTGALPVWNTGPDGVLWNADAFGWQVEDAPDGQASPFFVAVNCDEMAISRDGSLKRERLGRAETVLDRDHVDREAVAAGYTRAWKLLCEKRERVAKQLDSSEGATVRVVLRPTREYAELLAQGYTPPYCHDLVDRSLLFERLRRTLDGVSRTDPRWDLVDAEIDALVRGDVPLFTTQASRLALREGSGEGRTIRLKGTAPLTHARQCMRALNSSRTPDNDRLIVSALEVNEWPVTAVRKAVLPRQARKRNQWRGRLSAATALFEAVRAPAYTSSVDGSIAVVAATLASSGRAQQLGVADPADTYAGIAGLGLLAAALNAVRPTARYRDTAIRVADTLSACLEPLVSAGHHGRAGAYSGVTGVAYVLHVLGDLLGERSFSEHARSSLFSWASRIDEVGTDLDVMAGAAGGCMVALAIADEPRGALVEFVASRVACLRPAAIRDDSTCQWPRTGATQPSGFAHGSVGIALALSRVQRARLLACSDIDALVTGALTFELGSFDPVVSGWRHEHRLQDGTHSAAAGWCYGGAGMLLAGQELEADCPIEGRQLCEAAVHAILNEAASADGLCHGLSGSAAVLWQYGDAVGSKQSVQAAANRLDAIAQRCHEDNTVRLEPTSHLAHSAGLMTGATGIGIALLSPETDHLAARLLAVT